VFGATLGGTGVTSATDEGVWAWRGGTLAKVIAEGESFPGLPAGVVLGDGTTGTGALGYLPNAAGWVVGNAPVTGDGVIDANNRLLYAVDVDGGERLILAREGSPFAVAPGDERVVTGINLTTWGPMAADGGLPQGLNDANQLVIGLSFADGTSGVFSTFLPEPGGVGAMVLVTAAGLSARRARSAVTRRRALGASNNQIPLFRP
jgi:hypothetical protein